jgi:SEC-C motif domain protein
MQGQQFAPTTALLMRARYCAYVMHARDYLLTTWHPSTRPAQLEFDAAAQWLGLEIKQRTQHSATHATVEFVARYRITGKGHRLHEISRFECIDGRWFYVDGTFRQAKQFVRQ